MCLDNIVSAIKPLDWKKVTEGQVFCDRLAKPLGSLGKLETIYARLYAMFDGNIDLTQKVVMVYAADNGVVAEGISANPQETTYIVSKNMLLGRTGLGAIARYTKADIHLVDIGCCQDILPGQGSKVSYGTANMMLQAAMSKEDCIKAILIGYKETVTLIQRGYRLFGTGEMGIGNTTTSAAVISASLGLDPAEVTGYGAGLTDEMKRHKVNIIQKAIAKHAPYNDILDIVSKVGGLDMLGIAGTFLACAQYQLPCLVDGLISLTGLWIASQLSPHVLDYSFASHISTEPAYDIVSKRLNLQPMLLLDMRLGEGAGCPLAFSLMEIAVYTMEQMPTFEEGQLRRTDYIDIRSQ